MYKNLYKKKIPVMLLNARITKKTYNRWKYFPNFSKNIFNKITIALPQNLETKKYLKLLGVKNIKIVIGKKKKMMVCVKNHLITTIYQV